VPSNAGVYTKALPRIANTQQALPGFLLSAFTLLDVCAVPLP